MQILANKSIENKEAMEALKANHKRIISVKSAKKIVNILLFILLFDFLFFPIPVLASSTDDLAIISEEILENYSEISDIINNKPDNFLPVNQDRKVVRTGKYTITAYNSEVGQCDSTPCVTANGFNVCEHGIEDTIAANFLKFGTKVKIPELFGDRVFVVRDRMNKRYQDRIDVWMLKKTDARELGVKFAMVEVLE